MVVKREQTLTFFTNDDKKFPVKFYVLDGEDDYELWKKLNGNANKTREDYAKFKAGELGPMIVSVNVTETTTEINN